MAKSKSREPSLPESSRVVVDRTVAASRLKSVCFGSLAALFVAAPLIASDSIPQLGTTVVLSMLWIMLLALWTFAMLLDDIPQVRIGPSGYAMAALIFFHALSAILMIVMEEGEGRAAINMLWRWISFATAFFLTRQLAFTKARCRALCSVMLATSFCIATFGLFQYFYLTPKDQADFTRQTESEKKEWLESRGLNYAKPGTPERQHLEDRLFSVDARGTFALANSAAGFLAPWMILAIAIGAVSWPEQKQRKAAIVFTVASVSVLGLCLLLTKSRTGLLALGLGVVALAIYFLNAGLRIRKRVLFAAFVATVALIGLAAFVGGIDWQVITEAFKSFSYRLEYWQATWSMIWDHPWLGCGPGNFKANYTMYKLPQASETVADPHNFLLEVWATAGTLAMIALIGVITCAVIQIRRAAQGSTSEITNEETKAATSDAQLIYIGAAIGPIVAFVCGVLVGYPPGLAVFFVGVPAAVGVLVLLHAWVLRGKLNSSMLLVSIGVLFVNLLASGGIGFAGISLTLWLLLGLALNLGEIKQESKREFVVPRPGRWTLCVAGVVLVLVCQQTMLLPVMKARTLVEDGESFLSRRDLNSAEDAFAEAARADRFSPAPWQRLAWISLQRWHHSGEKNDQYLDQLSERVDEYRVRDPKAYLNHNDVGNLYLVAYRWGARRKHLLTAIESYREAVRLYPNSNIQHAQLAWAFHVAGNNDLARKEAERALLLDANHPHVEQKLGQRQLFDGFEGELKRDAEQVMLDLRKSNDAIIVPNHGSNES